MERNKYVEGKWQMTHLVEYSIVFVKFATKRPRHNRRILLKRMLKVLALMEYTEVKCTIITPITGCCVYGSANSLST
jgi:hypothetical protein